jgi:hypothetical protein
LATFVFAQSSIPITQLVSDHQLIENFHKKSWCIPGYFIKTTRAEFKSQSCQVERRIKCWILLVQNKNKMQSSFNINFWFTTMAFDCHAIISRIAYSVKP